MRAMKKLLKYTLIITAVAIMILPLVMPPTSWLANSLIQKFQLNPVLQFFSGFVFDADVGIANLSFIFACLAGIYTALKNKHLNISVVSENLPEKVRRVVNAVISVVGISILLALFFATFPNVLDIISPTDRVWGIPIRIVFLALSFMYLGLFIIEVKRTENSVAKVAGIFLGVLLSFGSILGVCYTLFHWNSEILSSAFSAITAGFTFLLLFCFLSCWRF